MARRVNFGSCSESDIEHLPDNSLLEIFRSDRYGKHSRDAVSILISRYLGLVLKRAHTFSGDYADVEDLTQEGLMAFYSAIDSFDASRNAKFSSYADICVSNKIKSVAARNARISSGMISGLSEESEIADTEISPENICLEKERNSTISHRISSVLSKKEFEVFRLYIDGVPYAAIASKLDISEKSVDNAVFRIRKKLKEFLASEQL